MPVPYRPYIDGLRAIAVLAVILFHFGWHTLPGGFLRFLDPETLLRIPVGDPEDEGDQID